ncbi:hypothetical protein RD792_016356 [Penstemon davidsonii]|uniref:Uncharacterized protein n=1 Tax=Penstemon davidsonii TaxID=160366 RepID=A0ABR0CJB4_9LAMI|nr:hypothetical protein RD792_016356 [Penstemon davidsonii]
MRTVTLIENNEQGNKDTQVDFDDKSSWEYLFKDYYIELKAKLSLSSVEIEEAKNPWKGGDMLSGPGKPESSETQAEANDGGSGSDDSTENLKTVKPKRRKVRKQSKSLAKEKQLVSKDVATGSRAISLSDNSEWASKELLEFVSHMKNGDTSFLSQFDVQALLLEYIKINKLRDPRRKSQIICDARLENLFGKPRVGHFEMLKLLELHFIARDEQTDEVQGSVVDTENNQLDIDDDLLSKGRRRKTRRKSVPQSNLDDYAAIDMHNISLIYLRRKLMEDLLEDAEMFHDKVVGTFVRIRISGSTQKQDLYRLVQVVGKNFLSIILKLERENKYSCDCFPCILNAGTSKAAEPYKVGKKTTDTMVEILNLDKTEVILIDTISNQEFTEEECKRLRQSIKCGLISRLTVGEILDKTMEIQVARVNDWLESEVLRLSHLRDRASDLGRRKEYPFCLRLSLTIILTLRECVEKLQLLKTPEERRRRLEEIPEIHADPKMDPSYESDEKDSESEESRRDAFMRSRVSGYSRRGRAPISPGSDNSSARVWESSRNPSGNSFSLTSNIDEVGNENSWNLEGDKDTQESNNIEKLKSVTNSDSPGLAVSRSESFSGVTPPETTAVKINESEKMWHYQDPSGKVQGPFSMVQLRKWNNTGYFPAGLKIWKTTENQDNSVLLADALAGKFPKELPSGTFLNLDRETSHVDQNLRSHTKLSSEKWARNDITNLPSPTPIQSTSVNGVLPSPTAVLPNISTHSSITASVLNSVVQSVNTYSPTPNSQHGILVGPTDSLHHQSTPTSQPVQPVVNQNLQPQNYGWAASNVQNPSGTFANPVPQPDFWRPPTQGNQPIMNSPAATPNAGWNAVQQANPNTAGWVNPVPGNTNMNWGPSPMQQQVPTPAGWVAPGGSAGPNVPGPVQGWAPAQAWGPPPVQGSVPVNGWVPPSGNSGVPAPPIQGGPQGNQGSWGGEQTQNGGQFMGQMGAQGRDSGFNGGRPWNRQQSFGGGGSSYFNKRDQICPYNANGRCRKGARCDYKHV